MAKQPAAVIQLEAYEDSKNYCGLAKVTLPTITYPCVNISGSGLMGNLEVPLYGMVDNMTTRLDWLSPTGDAVNLATPDEHKLELRVAEEFWDTEQGHEGMWADKYLMVMRSKSFAPGSVAPMAAADTNGEYVVYYFAGYRDGKKLWEIDKRNMKCVIGDKDYMADVRKALGK